MSVRWPRRAGLAGIDEAGRGPLAGPVVAAAVILPAARLIRGLDDSKRLAPAERERLAQRIRARALAWGLGWADAAEIDALNILEATLLAMRRALLALPVRPRALQVDGDQAPAVADLGLPRPVETVVGGDGREAAIAAASILAKTWRDGYMVAAEQRHPGYGFAAHKGYGTPEHLAALAGLGPCPLHRRSFEPVRSACARPGDPE
ncbi:MAG TPA: ribonuclease HII [Steroidobacteraceae bacterium]|nr:ribonuclease HII [Steroidobacteraceae bacterium]